MLQNLYAYRALRGGVWERTESCGWYRMPTPTGTQPTNTEDFEDHRDAWPLIALIAALLVLISVAAIAIWVKS